MRECSEEPVLSLGMETELRCELERQEALWGVPDYNDAEWLAILMVEVAGVSEHAVEPHFDNTPAPETSSELLDAELIQIAAVALRWVKSRRRHRGERT